MPTSQLEGLGFPAHTSGVTLEHHQAFECAVGPLSPPFTRLRSDAFFGGDTAEGPWSPGFCHGGAPAALIVHIVEAMPAPAEMGIARVTVDLMRPVPLGEVTVGARIVKEGRKLQLVDVEIRAKGTLVSRGSVLRLRLEGQTGAPELPDLGYPGAEAGVPTGAPTGVGFSRLFDMRAVRGSFEALGPAAVWFEMKSPLVAEEAMSASTRALACADFANGIASVLPFTSWSYPSTDLSVSFVREPVGPAILVDAECWAGLEGRGITHARLGDRLGWFGRSMQTTIFEKRRA